MDRKITAAVRDNRRPDDAVPEHPRVLAEMPWRIALVCWASGWMTVFTMLWPRTPCEGKACEEARHQQLVVPEPIAEDDERDLFA